MKKFMMIAVLALIAPLAHANDQAATETTTEKADMAAVEVTEATATTTDGATMEAVEIKEEAEATTTDTAK